MKSPLLILLFFVANACGNRAEGFGSKPVPDEAGATSNGSSLDGAPGDSPEVPPLRKAPLIKVYPENSDSPMPARKAYCNGAGADGLNCLRVACSKAGGTLTDEGACSCPANLVFEGWSGGSCVPLEFAQEERVRECLRREALHEVTSEHSPRCFHLGRVGKSMGTMRFISGTRKENSNLFLEQLRKKEVREFLAMTMGMEQVEIIFGKGDLSDEDARKIFVNAWPNTDSRVDSVLERAFYDSGLSAQESKNEVIKSLGEGHPLAMALRKSVKEYPVPSVSSNTDTGCAGVCVRLYTLSKEPGRVEIRHFFAGGRIYRKTLEFSEEKDLKRTLKRIVMFPNGKISVVFDLNESILNGRYVATLRAFSPSLNPISPVIDLSAADDLQVEMERLTIDSARANPKSRMALICEIGFSPLLLAKKGILRRRLSLPSDLRPKETIDDWVSTRYSFHDGLRSIDGSGGHSASVIEKFLTQPRALNQPNAQNISRTDSSDVQYATATPEQCFDLKFLAEARALGIRVVNVSMGAQYDGNVCRESHFGKAIRETRKDFLWVIAAGNDSQNLETGVDCPQNLSGEENVVIVGEFNSNPANQYSNFGKNYVDFMVEGRGGTSLQAPKVSAWASEIYRDMALFGETNDLLPSSVKQMLFNGVDRKRNSLPARIQGVFDPKSLYQLYDTGE